MKRMQNCANQHNSS